MSTNVLWIRSLFRGLQPFLSMEQTSQQDQFPLFVYSVRENYQMAWLKSSSVPVLLSLTFHYGNGPQEGYSSCQYLLSIYYIPGIGLHTREIMWGRKGHTLFLYRACVLVFPDSPMDCWLLLVLTSPQLRAVSTGLLNPLNYIKNPCLLEIRTTSQSWCYLLVGPKFLCNW